MQDCGRSELLRASYACVTRDELGAALHARLSRALLLLEHGRTAEAALVLEALLRVLPPSEPRHRAAAKETRHEQNCA
ncbi:hypothetical protein BH20PSE1_BH20PSE1_01340 [soil metagenome]